MSDWKEPSDREAAAYEFCKRLDQDENNALREACTKNMDTARETLKEAGQFANMPADILVYVYESEKTEERDTVVTIILPKKGTLPDHKHFKIREAWPCTWTPYPTLRNSEQKKKP